MRIIIFAMVISSSLCAQKQLRTSQDVREAVKSAQDKKTAAHIVIDGYNDFYFKSSFDKTNITTALKHFYRTYKESPLHIIQNKKVEMLERTYGENEGARVALNKENLALRKMSDEIRELQEELQENKRALDDLEQKYPLLTSKKPEDIEQSVRNEREDVKRLEIKRESVSRELEECRAKSRA